MGAFFSAFDWQHALLLGGSIIGGALVGIGVLKETKEWSSAAALVLIGILVEPVFTIGLFMYDESISRAQQSKIIALERQIAPRFLSADEIAALKAAVAPFTDRRISIWSYGIDLEAGNLAVQIKSVLDDAHVQTVDSIGHMISSWTPRIGVIVTGPDDKLVKALLKGLKPLNPTRGALPGGFTTLGETPTLAIVPAEIFVGVKPISP